MEHTSRLGAGVACLSCGPILIVNIWPASIGLQLASRGGQGAAQVFGGGRQGWTLAKREATLSLDKGICPARRLRKGAMWTFCVSGRRLSLHYRSTSKRPPARKTRPGRPLGRRTFSSAPVMAVTYDKLNGPLPATTSIANFPSLF